MGIGAVESSCMTEDRYQLFSARYANDDMPWDSGITPPEIVEIIAGRPAGDALDLGCGTGTVLRDLVLGGWRADGIDFVQRAIDLAARKLADLSPEAYRLYCGDVTRLEDLTALRPAYDLIIDIGCGHSIDKAANSDYARGVAGRLKPRGIFMLYASQPRPDSTVGWLPVQVDRLFGSHLELHWWQMGDDVAIGGPACWYKMRKPIDSKGEVS